MSPRVVNRIALTAVSIGLLLALTLGAVRMMSAPGDGEEVAERYGIPHPAIIAHRGASYLAPEGTHPAYLLARELGADYLELDVQRTKDRVLVVLHDRDLRRTTNVADVFPDREHERVEHFTFAEVEQLDAGSWFNRQYPSRARDSFRGLKILRLSDVIDLAGDAASRPGLYLEVKHPDRYPGIEKQIVGMLTARGWIRPPPANQSTEAYTPANTLSPAPVLFQSFDHESLARLKALAPQVPGLFLIDEHLMLEHGWNGLLSRANDVGVGIGTWGYRSAHRPGWSVKKSPKRYMTTWPWYTGDAHRAGLIVHPWTVDDRWEMWMLRVSGADGLFTNRSELAVVTYGRVDSIDVDPIWEKIGY